MRSERPTDPGRLPRIGTAGWTVPRAAAAAFPAQGAQLQRYAARFTCAEVNSCFYRPHRPATWARWAASVPAGFRFAVKAPRSITHEARLQGEAAPISDFLAQVAHLGQALGPVLIQLPPSLAFDADIAGRFFDTLRRLHAGDVVLEPRHPSWFEPAPEELLRGRRIARAAADPACCPAAGAPGGWEGLSYRRLHGSPRMYFSPYGRQRLVPVAASLEPGDWCILDNTASGAAIEDALLLHALWTEQRRSGSPAAGDDAWPASSSPAASMASAWPPPKP